MKTGKNMGRAAGSLLAGAVVLTACGVGVPPVAATARQTTPAPSSHGVPAAQGPLLSQQRVLPAGQMALVGRVVLLDPGHNGRNFAAPSQISRLVPDGVGFKACDTTGTQTASGYTEAAFNFDIVKRVEAELVAADARVVLTRPDNRGVGPCVDRRAAIGNAAHADAAISVHADGGPVSGGGFHVILPAQLGQPRDVVSRSRLLGRAVHDAFRTGTGEGFATYISAGSGYSVRADLAGLNLTTVPKIFIECGNMRNPADAGRLSDPSWRQLAADALTLALTTFLTRPAA